MQTASNFIKYHTNCWAADQLSEETRLEASQQKRRIKEAVDHRLKKRGRDEGTDRPNKRLKEADTISALQIPHPSNSRSEPSNSGMHELVVVGVFYAN